jgi:peptidoglycan/LPS O-acetylase OafA/YrhL
MAIEGQGAPADSQSGDSRFNLAVGGGLFLIAIAIAALIGSYSLKFGQMSGIGAGLMPRMTALVVGAFGILLVVQGVRAPAQRLQGWSIRGLVFVVGAVVLFGASIRPFGLAVAGPIAILLAAFADPNTRLKEALTFAILLTIACIVLFKVMLRLPIPLAPFALGY